MITKFYYKEPDTDSKAVSSIQSTKRNAKMNELLEFIEREFISGTGNIYTKDEITISDLKELKLLSERAIKEQSCC